MVFLHVPCTGAEFCPGLVAWPHLLVLALVSGFSLRRLLGWVSTFLPTTPYCFSLQRNRPRAWSCKDLWLLGGSDGKASVYNEGDPGSVPGSGRSPGEGNGNPLQYYCLGNPMDRGAWWATVHGSQGVGHDWVTSLYGEHTWIQRHLRQWGSWGFC